MADYKVQFEVFEGPLDLLLYLVKKEEVDIYEVNLTKIATEFVAYVDLMRELDLDIAGEFLVMAATLMFIKSRELLPVEQQAQVEGEEDDAQDPRWELIRQLVEYKKFKNVAGELQQREECQENTYPRVPVKPDFATEAPALRPDVSIFDLINAVNAVLKRFSQSGETRDIFEDKWTVSEKITLLRQFLNTQPCLKFTELFSTATSRSEVVVTFLAMLELIRLRVIIVTQRSPFSEIEIERAPEPLAAAQPAAAPPDALPATTPSPA